MATATDLPRHELIQEPRAAVSFKRAPRHSQKLESLHPALITTYSWPALVPKGFHFYHAKHLTLPMRRDILHRAVIFEADASRQGTASTKWRKDVRGSGRKIRPQKGTGMARLGDKKSPMLRGGGVAFGPHPRDFSTGLQRKVYDLAFRTALSYRYKKGELVVLDNEINIEGEQGGRYLNNVFEGNRWGREHGRSLLVTESSPETLFEAMRTIGEHGLVKDMYDVDVKDLLETGRIVMEKHALDNLLFAHASDLGLRADLDFAKRADKAKFLLNASSGRQQRVQHGAQHLEERDQAVLLEEMEEAEDGEQIRDELRQELPSAPTA